MFFLILTMYGVTSGNSILAGIGMFFVVFDYCFMSITSTIYHELGHYLACKIYGYKVVKFHIGEEDVVFKFGILSFGDINMSHPHIDGRVVYELCDSDDPKEMRNIALAGIWGNWVFGGLGFLLVGVASGVWSILLGIRNYLSSSDINHAKICDLYIKGSITKEKFFELLTGTNLVYEAQD